MSQILREKNFEIPILMLKARDAVADLVRGYYRGSH